MTLSDDDLRLAHRAIAHLRRPNAGVYFVDLFATAAVTWAAVAIAGTARGRDALSFGSFAVASVVAGLALSRAVLFAHELSHQRGSIPGLRLVWHVLIGVPFMFPSFLYEHVHRRHHHVTVYRTKDDPEHAPDPRGFVARTLTAQLGALSLPFLLAARWLLVPFMPSSRRLRSLVQRRFSSLTLNASYERPRRRTRGEVLAETACAIWTYGVLAALVLGVVSWRAPAACAVAITVAASVSDLRGDVLHRFEAHGKTGTLQRQVLDSVNLASTSVLVRLLFPMGIGYHALHHLAPSIPYHAVRAAHAEVSRVLGPRSPYARGTVTSLWEALRRAHPSAETRWQVNARAPGPSAEASTV